MTLTEAMGRRNTPTAGLHGPLAESTQEELAQLWQRMARRDLLRKTPLNPLMLLMLAVTGVLLPSGQSMMSVLMLTVGLGLSLFDSPYAVYVWRFWLCWGAFAVLLNWGLSLWRGIALYRRRTGQGLPPVNTGGAELADLVQGHAVVWEPVGEAWWKTEVSFTAPQDGYYVFSLVVEDIRNDAVDAAWLADGKDLDSFFSSCNVVPDLRGVFTVFLKLQKGTHRLHGTLNLKEQQPATLRQVNRV